MPPDSDSIIRFGAEDTYRGDCSFLWEELYGDSPLTGEPRMEDSPQDREDMRRMRKIPELRVNLSLFSLFSLSVQHE